MTIILVSDALLRQCWEVDHRIGLRLDARDNFRVRRQGGMPRCTERNCQKIAEIVALMKAGLWVTQMDLC